MRERLPSNGSATQTEPAPTARALMNSAFSATRRETTFLAVSICAIPPSSTIHTSPSPAAINCAFASTRATTRFVRGSIRETVWSGLMAQTASGVTASFCRLKPPMPVGWPPAAGGRSTVPTTTPDAGSIRDTLSGKSLSPRPGPLPTQTAPAPAAMSVGRDAVLKTRRTSFVSGSICVTVLSSPSRTQTLPSPTATLDGAVPKEIVSRTAPVSGSSAIAPAVSCAASSPASRHAPTATATASTTAPATAMRTGWRHADAGTIAGRVRRGDAPSSGSCSRIWRSRRRSDSLGWSPSSAARCCRPSWYACSACAWRPARYSASMS